MTGVLTVLSVMAVGVSIGLGLGALVFGRLLNGELANLRDTLDARVCRFDRIPPGKPADPLVPVTSVPLRGTIGEGDRA